MVNCPNLEKVYVRLGDNISVRMGSFMWCPKLNLDIYPCPDWATIDIDKYSGSPYFEIKEGNTYRYSDGRIDTLDIDSIKRIVILKWPADIKTYYERSLVESYPVSDDIKKKYPCFAKPYQTKVSYHDIIGSGFEYTIIERVNSDTLTDIDKMRLKKKLRNNREVYMEVGTEENGETNRLLLHIRFCPYIFLSNHLYDEFR